MTIEERLREFRAILVGEKWPQCHDAVEEFDRLFPDLAPATSDNPPGGGYLKARGVAPRIDAERAEKIIRDSR